MSNSFGATSDVGTDFDPERPDQHRDQARSPTAASSSCSRPAIPAPAKARSPATSRRRPGWSLAAAGNKTGNLANFSSRGLEAMAAPSSIDGEDLARGTTARRSRRRASTSSRRAPRPATPGPTSRDETIPARLQAVLYDLERHLDGGAAFSGVVALMLEANPQLGWRDVKRHPAEDRDQPSGRRGLGSRRRLRERACRGRDGQGLAHRLRQHRQHLSQLQQHREHQRAARRDASDRLHARRHRAARCSSTSRPRKSASRRAHSSATNTVAVVLIDPGRHALRLRDLAAAARPVDRDVRASQARHVDADGKRNRQRFRGVARSASRRRTASRCPARST